MSPTESAQVRVIGCGRRHRGDDQAGLLVAEAVIRQNLAKTKVTLSECPGTDLIDDLDGVELLIIADAARAQNGFSPGTWSRFDYGRSPARLKPKNRGNTHELGVDAALELGRELGVLPEDVWIYAIAVDETGYAEEVSEAVKKAIPGVAEKIHADIRAWFFQRKMARA